MSVAWVAVLCAGRVGGGRSCDAPAASVRGAGEWRTNRGKVSGVVSAVLHRDALRQIARLVDVAAAAHRDVVRQQLQRHDLQDRRQQLATSAGSR